MRSFGFMVASGIRNLPPASGTAQNRAKEVCLPRVAGGRWSQLTVLLLARSIVTKDGYQVDRAVSRSKLCLTVDR